MKISFSRVAVLLAAYNGEKWLINQLDSILQQKQVRITVYISLDLSTDKSFELCNVLSEKYQNICFLSYGHKFGGAAKNFFRLFREVDFSAFDYIALADQDDIWHKEKLSRAIEAINHHTVDAYSSNVTAFWDNGQTQEIVKSQPQRKFDFLFEAAGPGCTYVLTQKLALDIQQFLLNCPESDEFILHDWLFYAYARSRNYQWFIDSRSFMSYRQHASNQVGVNINFKAKLKRAKYVLFGGGLMQVRQLLSFMPEEMPYSQWKGFRRYDILKLILSFNQLRRKPSERFYVFLILVIAFIFGVNKT